MNVVTGNDRAAAGADRANSPGGSSPQRAWTLLRFAVDGLLGFLALLACVLAGEAIRRWTRVPMPGPVIGLTLLALVLVFLNRLQVKRHLAPIEPVSRLLVSHMGLLFVPAGVGIIAEGAVLRTQLLPILAGVLGSTIIGLATAGWLMHRHLVRTTGSGIDGRP